MLKSDLLTFTLLPRNPVFIKNRVSLYAVQRVKADLAKGGDRKQQLFSKIG